MYTFESPIMNPKMKNFLEISSPIAIAGQVSRTVPSIFIAGCSCFVAISTVVGAGPAHALVVGGLTVNSNRTGVGVPVPPIIGWTFPFQVTVAGADPDPNIRLTDFTVQLSDNITGLDRATFNWYSVPGWNVTTNNLGGNAYFVSAGYASGIAIGGTLTGFEVQGVGTDLAATGVVNITGTSWTTINPAPPPTFITTRPVPGPLPILGTAAAFGYSRKLRKRINRSANVATTTSA